MQVTETLSQGLKREYNVVVSRERPRLEARRELNDLKGKVRINGFRPGKVPMAHLKKGLRPLGDGRCRAEADRRRQQADRRDNGLRLAMQPKIELSKEQNEIEAALEASGDLAFKIELEVLPQFEIGDFAEISLERPVADVEESEVEASCSGWPTRAASSPSAPRARPPRAATG